MAEIHRHPNNPSGTIYGEKMDKGQIIEPGDVYDSVRGMWRESIIAGLPIINDRFYWVRPIKEEK